MRDIVVLGNEAASLAVDCGMNADASVSLSPPDALDPPTGLSLSAVILELLNLKNVKMFGSTDMIWICRADSYVSS